MAPAMLIAQPPWEAFRTFAPQVRSQLLTMSNNIQNVAQMVLPFYPRLLPVRQFHRRHMGEATRLLKDSEEFQHIGVAVTQSEHGVLQHLVLSTSEHIVAISLDGNSRELSTANQSFRSLLREDQDVVMVGFDMARLAIHIHRRLGFQVRGVDLSTLCSGSTNSPWSPSKMVARKLYNGVDTFAVDGLWHADDLRDACLRAWISSWSVPLPFNPVALSDIHCAIQCRKSMRPRYHCL